MTDMGGGNFRVFDPAKEREFEDNVEPFRPAPLRDRLRQIDAEKQPPRPAAARSASESESETAPEAPAKPDTPALGENAALPIGVVLEVSGAGSQIAIDTQRLTECVDDPDPSIAMTGQVGSQIKIRVGNSWLLASVRDQKQDRRAAGSIVASIDFLGEGKEEKLTGKLHAFRRGVTRYPVPGAMIYPATTQDLRQVYASDGRSSVQIGTVYPTKDIRAGLYVDAMLGKH
ncbi:MAG: ATPase, partial [Erythrobacter sp.]|nr:ATPase [Erythrobacter sp.]